MSHMRVETLTAIAIFFWGTFLSSALAGICANNLRGFFLMAGVGCGSFWTAAAILALRGRVRKIQDRESEADQSNQGVTTLSESVLLPIDAAKIKRSELGNAQSKMNEIDRFIQEHEHLLEGQKLLEGRELEQAIAEALAQ